MEKIISFFLAIIAGLLVSTHINFNKYNLPPALSYYLRTIAPCSNPIYFKIGSVDPQFNVSRDTLISDANQAANIWNKTYGKTLFVYNAKGSLTVNFIYDERQSFNTKLNTIKDALQNEKTQLQPNEIRYKNLVADFNQRSTNLNNEINDWNRKGGAPPDVYQKLLQEQADLKSEINQINTLARQLNISVAEYNSVVTQLNQSAANFNEAIQNKPEEGLYSPSKNEIDIYLIINHDELVHTLAHELGHALGLVHTTDSRSIMFSLTSKTTTTMPADITDLNNLCSHSKSQQN